MTRWIVAVSGTFGGLDDVDTRFAMFLTPESVNVYGDGSRLVAVFGDGSDAACAKTRCPEEFQALADELAPILREAFGVESVRIATWLPGAKGIIDEAGVRYGKLKVLRLWDEKPDWVEVPHALWLTECDCGNKRAVEGGYLRRGAVLDCGFCGTPMDEVIFHPSEMALTAYGKRLDSMLRKTGKDPQWLEKKTGLSKATVNRLRRHPDENVSDDTLRRVALAMKSTAEEMCAGTEFERFLRPAQPALPVAAVDEPPSFGPAQPDIAVTKHIRRKACTTGDAPLLKTEDVAALLGVKVSTARYLMRRGAIPAVKVGKRYYVPKAKLYAHLGMEA